MITRILVAIFFMSTLLVVQAKDVHQDHEHEETHQVTEGHDEHDTEGHEVSGHHESKKPAAWSVIPFVLLLIMIATGPLFYPHFWHKSYPVIALILAFLVSTYYLLVLENVHSPVHSMAEYVQFIALISGLFVASGGILIVVDKDAKPLTDRKSFWLLVPSLLTSSERLEHPCF